MNNLKKYTLEINMGDEFITLSPEDADGGYILKIEEIQPSKSNPLDDLISYSVRHSFKDAEGVIKHKKILKKARRWWLRDHCVKITREI